MTTPRGPGRPIRFGDQLVPTHEYARAWEAEFPQRFPEYIAAYRERVGTFWPDLAAVYPEAFRLREPVEVVGIATLASVWFFARPSPTDQDIVRVIALWEHPELDTWDMQQAPPEHQRRRMVEVALDGDESYRMLYGYGLAGHTANLDRPMWLPASLWLTSWRLADDDAEVAAAMTRHLDRAGLATARARLDALRTEPNSQKRGKQLEQAIVDVLAAHGAEVELGQLGQGEQVDVFILRPFFALLECRWRKKPVEPRDISDLIVKLRHRPPAVAGLYVSMTGFTSGAQDLAARSPERMVVLVTPHDLEVLLSGETTLGKWWHARVVELVKRYPITSARGEKRHRK